MPRFETNETLPASLSRVFDFFRRPANLIAISPPELHLQLLSAPEQLVLGARIALQARRWGLSRRLVSEVTLWQPEACFVDEQREGPFAQWIHTHRFEEVPGVGTRVTDRIDFEPPLGMLGLLLTAKTIERDLQGMFAYRQSRLLEWAADRQR